MCLVQKNSNGSVSTKSPTYSSWFLFKYSTFGPDTNSNSTHHLKDLIKSYRMNSLVVKINIPNSSYKLSKFVPETKEPVEFVPSIECRKIHRTTAHHFSPGEDPQTPPNLLHNDQPSTKSCMKCMFDLCRLCIADNSQPLVTVKGFADYTDVNAEDLVPWTPLKAGKKGLY